MILVWQKLLGQTTSYPAEAVYPLWSFNQLTVKANCNKSVNLES